MSAELVMSTLEARKLTEQIKSAAGDLAEMLYRAHNGKAWDALGYKTWNQYVDEELRMSKQHAFRLIDFVEVKNNVKVHEKSPIGDSPVPTHESQARPLTKLPAEQQPAAWSKAVESANGAQPTAKQVEAAVEEVRAEAEPEAPKRERAFQPSNGMQYAALAIENLKKIQPNDTERDKAYMAVQRFLTQNYQAK